MNKKRKVVGRVVCQQSIASGIYEIYIETDLSEEAMAGQFIGIYPLDRSTLLPRPISICEVDRSAKRLRLVYRVAGSGTAELSAATPGDELYLLGVLGNGFPMDATNGKTIAVMGGGIGIPPLLEVVKTLSRLSPLAKVHSFLGYRDGQRFLLGDFEQYSTVHVATEDGSYGIKGNVMSALNRSDINPDMIMSCGPMPMLRAIKGYSVEQSIRAYISLEERMACGIGACLGCVCRTTAVDHHSHVNNARICTDGPVFDANEVDI
ncbi:MAG: dihydroorotate dehydrogenase electron transfer subunit [Lachnospiraceae bacterium]|jgi:dihydroorotate dehydrogenase electron transfer subunit|nr:dihydroorotate dehydrogenase electron transfer subunit [Lachnospiraceae bacterium]